MILFIWASICIAASSVRASLGGAPQLYGCQWSRNAPHFCLNMVTTLGEPHNPLDDDERHRQEAAREFTEWLFSDQPAPTQEERNAVLSEWKSEVPTRYERILRQEE
jgi:hypothetical protein